jgi:hypothetical protein
VHGHHAFLLLSCAGSHTMVLDARGPRLEEVTEDVSDPWGWWLGLHDGHGVSNASSLCRDRHQLHTHTHKPRALSPLVNTRLPFTFSHAMVLDAPVRDGDPD